MGNMDDPGADWNELARENAALRKRVEELEASQAYWKDVGQELRAVRDRLEARLEKAERERDEMQARCDEDRAEWVKDMERVREINAKLQADLDTEKESAAFMAGCIRGLQADLDAALLALEAIEDQYEIDTRSWRPRQREAWEKLHIMLEGRKCG